MPGSSGRPVFQLLLYWPRSGRESPPGPVGFHSISVSRFSIPIWCGRGTRRGLHGAALDLLDLGDRPSKPHNRRAGTNRGSKVSTQIAHHIPRPSLSQSSLRIETNRVACDRFWMLRWLRVRALTTAISILPKDFPSSSEQGWRGKARVSGCYGGASITNSQIPFEFHLGPCGIQMAPAGSTPGRPGPRPGPHHILPAVAK